ncbi:MAG: ARMT1-like domain-containing protein [bacterium]|nr:ARMT1-like domain-containing protein [bacterium]
MKTSLDCIPCFFRQALEAARIAGANESKQKKILEEVCRIIPNISLNVSPPEIGRAVYALIIKETGILDPFKKIKDKSNKFANDLYPILKDKVKNSKDKLLSSIDLAIAGNVIDYGAKNSLNIEEEIEKILKYNPDSFSNNNKSIFDYQKFKEALSKTEKVLYLADNAGEVLFDRILIEEMNKEVIYVVKDKPIINDALAEDAYACGLDKCSQIISNGYDAPGTVLNYCSKDFLNIYERSDLIISKGQGNFETLAEENGPIYFLVKVKCPVVAKNIGGKVGDIVLKGPE